ncbi:Ribosomal protein L30, bacterial-type [mine drainage metagenome]|uniref:Ribosomal protein L30, bacterial-type n=1 Tax=mine drainage metagenome TaxID=410659 RepID=T1BMS8_9ZZZZ
MTQAKAYKVTLIRSLAKKSARHRASVHGLGLRRIGGSVVVSATPENLGMIRAVSYLLKVEAIDHAAQ